ncbi:T9SS type A sorting domain-containing protein [candidate division KSB1 bacterium]|nr:T9SS type A sorting domain-containing protein [candidate division KSB1 bacterium]
MKILKYFILLITFFPFQNQATAQYLILKSVISSSGSSLLSDSYVICATLGQPVTGMTSGSSYELSQGFWDSSSPCSVPVELSSFSFVLSEKSVILIWETKTETNNFGFNIERKSIQESWEKIGFVSGNGTVSSPREYKFKDNTIIESGDYFYRLKQIDSDGSSEYSPTIEVIIHFPHQYELSENFPNPFNPETRIDYQLPKSAYVEIRIYNTLGQEIRTLLMENKDAGFHHIFWDGKDNSGKHVGTGTYFYQLKTDDSIDVKKMTLLR